MRYSLDVHADDFGRILTAFLSISGWEAWKRRLADLDQAQKRSSVMRDYLGEKHAIEFELARLLRMKRATGRLPGRVESNEFYRLASLSRVVVAVHAQLSANGKTRLRGMLLDALKNDFASIEHEMHVATHLVKSGFEIEFPDIEGTGQFDLLAERKGQQIEIECKAVGYDLGRKVHRSDFNALAEKLYQILSAYIDGNGESKIVLLSLQERLNNSDQLVSRICGHVRDALERGQEHIDDADLSLECRNYKPESLPPDTDALWKQVEGLLQTDQFHMFLHGDSSRVVIFVARSRRPDQVLTGILRQMRGASDQLTRTRPAIVCVQVEGVDPHEWQTLASGSGLQRMTHKYLSSPSRSHVHSVAYNSTGWLQRRGSVVTGEGAVLYFQNPAHPMRDDPLVSIFR